MFEAFLNVTVVTPDGLVREEKVSSISLQTMTGQIEILQGHAPMVTLLEPGEMCLRNAAGEEYFALGAGFAEIDSDRVNVFSDLAENADAIAVETAHTAMQRAKQMLAESAGLSADERSSVELQVQECVVKINISSRRKRQGLDPGKLRAGE